MGLSLFGRECLDGSDIRLHSRPHPMSPQVTPGCLRSPAVTVHRRMTNQRPLAIKHRLRVAGHHRSPQVTQVHRWSPAIDIAGHRRLRQDDLESARFALPAIRSHLRSPQATPGHLWLDPGRNLLGIYSFLIHLKFIYNCFLSYNDM